MPRYEEFEEAFGVGQVSGPTQLVRNLEGVAVRPASKALKAPSDRARLANVYCRRRARQLLAVIYGPVSHFHIVSSAGLSEFRGSDVLATCRCGWDHVMIAERLEREVSELRPRGRRVPTLFVDTMERLPPEEPVVP